MSLVPVGLRCEHLVAPLGLGQPSPLLSWQIAPSPRRGAAPTAWQIQAAASEAALLSATPALLWDSGRVEGPANAVVWGAAPLASRTRVVWRVRLWDEAAAPGPWSEPTYFELGFLRKGDWHGDATFIGGTLRGGPRTSVPCPLLRHAFVLPAGRAIARARLYATALGLYEARLNGAKVGQDHLTPGYTDYARRLQVQTYDVTAALHPGENVLAALLGDGWFCGCLEWSGRAHYGDQPQFCAQLEVTLADGERLVFCTGPGWRVCYGPLLQADLQQGEHWDARWLEPGWDTPGFSDVHWPLAECFALPVPELCAPVTEPVRDREVLRPRETTTHHGRNKQRWVFDFGQNLVGVVRLRVRGPNGTHLRLRHAEVLEKPGQLHIANLRGAAQTDLWTLAGTGDWEEWTPRFTLHGFRYAELTVERGTIELAPDGVEAIVRHSDFAETGTFDCSHPLLNQLYRNIRWGMKGNYVEVPTDCPQRDERMGWTGDAQMFVRTGTTHGHIAAFFAKWLRDLSDAERETGSIPCVVPDTRQMLRDGGPAWADAAVICPAVIFEAYADARLLAELFPLLRRFVDRCVETSDRLMRGHAAQEWRGFGDWLSINAETPQELIGTAFLAHSAGLLAQIATTLGKPVEAAHYRALRERVKARFQEAFVSPDGTVSSGTQTSYVLALHFDLLPPALRPAAVRALVADIASRGGKLSTGFVGQPYLPWVLDAAGEHETLFGLLLQQEWPSWLYAVTQGATTIWERWDGWTHDRGFQDPGMNSFNHYAFGAVGDWLVRRLAGLDQAPGDRGWQRLRLAPLPGGGLTQARSSLSTPQGEARCGWELAPDGSFTLNATVPPGATAEVHLPATPAHSLTESGAPVADGPGFRLRERTATHAIFEIGSGSYVFRARVA